VRSLLLDVGGGDDLGGEVKIDFAPTGVVCTVNAPLNPA